MADGKRPFPVRAATMADVALLKRLIELSVRRLQRKDYSEKQLEEALGAVLGLDTQLIEDGMYLVAEHESAGIVGCGGWSKRKTLFGSDRREGREDTLLVAFHETAGRLMEGY